MKQRKVKLIYVLLCLISIGVVTCGVVALNWINSIPKQKEVLKTQKSQDASGGAGLIEEGATYSPQLLAGIFLFSEDGSSLGFNDKTQALQVAEEDIEIPPLIENSCEEFYCMQHRLSFEEIPSVLWKGLIGIEDYRFLNHQGVDPVSIARAFWADLKAMSFVQGGSTLTMQLVKNLLLTREKSLKRKLKEMVMALYIEYFYSKEEILTTYFNETFWGSLQGVKLQGVYAASIFYFQKSPKDLSGFETSILIALLKGPYFYHPIHRLDNLKKRVAFVVKKLKERELVYYEDGSEWTDRDWKSWQKKLIDLNEKKIFRHLVLIGKNPGISSVLPSLAIHQGSNTTQKILTKRIKKKDVAIKFFSKSIYCSTEPCEEIRFYSKAERSLDSALRLEKHQTGSIFKPILYSLYGQQGITLSEKVSTEKITLNLISGKWSPRDAPRNEPLEIPVREALMNSRNRPTIRLAQKVGFEFLEQELSKYFNSNLKKPLGEFPAQLIGAVELSVFEVWEVYKKFLLQKCSKEGNKVDPVISALSLPKYSTIRKVVDKRLENLRFFGKTGTTNQGFDSWYISFDGDYLSITWMGLEGERGVEDLNLSGAGAAFRVFQNYQLLRGKRWAELQCIDEV